MDDDRRTGHHETPRRIVTGDDPRRLQLVIVVLVAVIVVLLLRPWGGDVAPVPVAPGPTPAGVGLSGPGTAPGSPTEGVAHATTPAGAATETPAPRHVSCGSPDGWRATTVQQWPNRILPVRSWIAIEPTEATGPTDPAIPLAPVAASVVTAIGYCAPTAARLQPPAGAAAMLWTLTPTGPLALTPVGLDQPGRYRQGVLWLPAPELGALPRGNSLIAWPPGSYVIEIAGPGRTFDLWLGLEILDLERRAGPDGSPAPIPSAASDGSAPG